MHSLAVIGLHVVRRRLASIFMVIVALALMGCTQKIDAAQVQVVNGLVYKLHDREPFTGSIRNIAIHEVISIAGGGSCERRYKAGRLHGETTCTSDSGHKVLEQEWEQGKRHGVERMWHPKTGQLHVDSHWKDGRRDGSFELYNPEIVKLIVSNEYKAGDLEGRQQIWDAATGTTLLVDMRWRNGKQTGFTKLDSTEEHYRDGKLHGVRRTYTIEGPDKIPPVLAAQGLVEQLRGGGYFMGMYAGARVTTESVYENGMRMSYKEHFSAPKPVVDVEACVDKWIAAHRKEVGQDAVVRADQLDEWASWCKQGRQP